MEESGVSNSNRINQLLWLSTIFYDLCRPISDSYEWKKHAKSNETPTHIEWERAKTVFRTVFRIDLTWPLWWQSWSTIWTDRPVPCLWPLALPLKGDSASHDGFPRWVRDGGLGDVHGINAHDTYGLKLTNFNWLLLPLR